MRMRSRTKSNVLPVDRGWAWAVAAGGFLAHVIMGASGSTNSVLFVEILSKFQVSITTGSLMFMCTTLAFSISSWVVTAFVLPKLDERRCVMIGGLLCSGLSLAASLAPNMGVFITFVALKGAAHGFIFVPAIALCRYYFDRLRSRASVVPWCGGSVAGIIAPFIIRAVRKEYGVSGAYFLLSAVELNFILAGLLLRPLSAYRYRPDEEMDATNQEQTVEKNSQIDSSSNKQHVENISQTAVVSPPGQDGSPETAGDRKEKFGQEDHMDATREPLLHHGDKDAVSQSLHDPMDNQKKEQEEWDLKDLIKLKEASDTAPREADRKLRERRNTFLGSVLTLDSSEVVPPLEFILQDSTDKDQSDSDQRLTRWQKLYRDSALDLYSFRWTILAVLPGTVNGYLLSYLATISKFQGASLDEVALLVTFMACVDLVSRIGCGFIADSKLLPPSKMVAIGQLCIGVAAHLYRLTYSFTTLIPIICFFGMFIGSRGPLISLMCLEVVGTHKMPQAYSLISMFNTLCIASMNPILGAVVEAAGSFLPVMHIVGTGYMLCGVMVAFIPVFQRMDVKSGRKPPDLK